MTNGRQVETYEAISSNAGFFDSYEFVRRILR